MFDLGRSVYVFAKIALGEVAVFVNTSQKISVWLECIKRSVELKVYAKERKIIATKR